MDEDISVFTTLFIGIELTDRGVRSAFDEFCRQCDLLGTKTEMFESCNGAWIDLVDHPDVYSLYFDHTPYPLLTAQFSLTHRTISLVRQGLDEEMVHLGDDVWLGDRALAAITRNDAAVTLRVAPAGAEGTVARYPAL